MNHSILRTENLKAFYVLDMHGTQKIVYQFERRPGPDLSKMQNR